MSPPARNPTIVVTTVQDSAEFPIPIPVPSHQSRPSTPSTATTVQPTVSNLHPTTCTDPVSRSQIQDDRGAVAVGVPTTRQFPNPPSRTSSPAPQPRQLQYHESLRELPTRTESTYQTVKAVQTPSQEDFGQDTHPAAKRRKLNVSRPTEPDHERSDVVPPVKNSTPAVEAENEDSVATAITEAGPSSQCPKPQQKRVSAKAKGKQRIEDMAAAIIADASRGGRKPQSTKRKPKEGAVQGGRTRKKRCPTPESSETVQIAPAIMKMSELCKDLHVGKKSVRAEEIRLFEIEEAAKKRERQQEAEDQQVTQPETAAQLLERLGAETEQSENAQAQPVTQIINGEIMLVEGSQRIDRHAEAARRREAEPTKVVEESSLTTRVNSQSYMSVQKKEKWGEELTDRFYDGLRMFGTDFGMISKMFPGRTRRAIKLKFSKEEKLDKEKIKETLLGKRIPVNMEEFSKLTNTVYNDPAELERELEEDRKRLEEEQAKEREAMDEVVRQRDEEAAAEGAAVGGDSSAKENEIQTDAVNQGKKTGKRGKKASSKASNKPPPKSRRNRPKGLQGGGEAVVLGPIMDQAAL